jgi:D-alanyl-D-alanine carboxypeptidase
MRPAINIALRAGLLAAALVAAPPLRAQDSDALQRALLQRMAELGCPGTLVAVDRPGQPPLRLALGVADVQTGRPMSTDLHMRVASLSKLFVGTAALRLAELGRLDLQQVVGPGVPGGESITLLQLGRHQSGLGDAIADPALRRAIAADPPRVWTTDELLALAFAQPRRPPGTLRYANTNSMLLGRAIAAAGGQPAEAAITALVIGPLQLRHTGFTPASGLPEPFARGYRHGRRKDPVGYGDWFFDATAYSASWAGVAGNLYSTLDDFARAIKPLATGSLLDAPRRALLHHFQPVDAMGIAHGFQLMQREGGLGHTGDVPGYSATALYLPALDTSVVVLTNLSNSAGKKTPAVELEALVLRWLRRG